VTTFVVNVSLFQELYLILFSETPFCVLKHCQSCLCMWRWRQGF